jgi:hypothetical protein
MTKFYFGGLMSSKTFRGRNIVTGVLLLIIIVAGYILGGMTLSGSTQFASPSSVAQPVGDLPNMPDKPQPQEITFDGCPPEGTGGDPQLNLLKNRVDEGRYSPVSFDSITSLTWPKSVEEQNMAGWSADSRAFIQQYEGIPVKVEGYFVMVRESDAEPANCGRSGMNFVDWHIWFTQGPRDDRSTAVIVEITARVRMNHKWTLDLIRSPIIDDHLPVRISGWLFFDPEHPNDVGTSRATLWEIHPVMQIEIFQSDRWIPLDKFTN